MKNNRIPSYLLALTVLVLAGCTTPAPKPVEPTPAVIEQKTEVTPDLEVIDSVIDEILEEATEEPVEIEVSTPEVETTTETLSVVETEPVVPEPVYIAPYQEPVYTEPAVEASTYEEPKVPSRRSRAS